tara:strand:+ start:564 stop:1412 length:849 start_codon:yes stop_codon:yes gene_type:complete
MFISNALNFAQKELKKENIKSSTIDSEVLLSYILKKERSCLLVNQDSYILSKSQLNKFKDLIEQRKEKKPVSQIIGKKYFWKCSFYVNKFTLTPRPETEHLIELSLKNMNNFKKNNILDIGTGSGCIIISLLKETKSSSGVAIDICKEALNVAKYNAKMHHIQNRIKFFKSSVDKFLFGTYDLIVSNPPYINKIKLKYLEEDVINYDPKISLNGGKEGLEIIKSVIFCAKKLCKYNGKLILEIDPIQKKRVINILKKNGFNNCKVFKDYSQKERFIIGTKTN